MRKSLFLIIVLLVIPCCVQRGSVKALPESDVTRQSFNDKRVLLENGLTVIAVERHKLPVFQAILVVKAGSAHDPNGRGGLANLTANLLNKGTERRTASEIAEEIDFTGGSLDASCGRTTTRVSVHVLVEHAPLAMDLLSDAVMRPSLREDELEREKSRVLAEIMRRREDPFEVVTDAFYDMVYESSPLRKPVRGCAATLEEVGRTDVVQFHKDHYQPGNAVLVLVADLSIQEMIDIAGRYLGSWEDGVGVEPLALEAKSPEGKSVRLVNMDINQSYVALGHLGLKRQNPDYSAVVVMNYILGGGGFVSRIMKSIRAEQGLAYSVYSYFVPGTAYRGYFRAGLQTKTNSTSQALNSLLEEIKRMRDEPVTEQELEDAQTFYEGSLPRRQETYSQVAGLFVDREIYGLEDDYWVKDLELIRSLTSEDIQRVAREYLDPDNFVIAIASKADSLSLVVEGITQDMIEVMNP